MTPAQIATAALEAAEAGAAAAHIHVRDPETGRPSMALEYYAEVIELIRKRNKALIINLTTGPGGRFAPGEDEPRNAAPGTTLVRPEVRVAHIAALRPDVCSLDLNTMNSGAAVVIDRPERAQDGGHHPRGGVMPELEIFDSGDLHMARDFIQEGVLDGPGLWPSCSA